MIEATRLAKKANSLVILHSKLWEYTDPVRMHRLYPDLRGANPLVRSRRVDEHDIQRFQQFRLGHFVNVQENAQTAMDFTPQIKTLLDVFVQRIATRTLVFSMIINRTLSWTGHICGVIGGHRKMSKATSRRKIYG